MQNEPDQLSPDHKHLPPLFELGMDLYVDLDTGVDELRNKYEADVEKLHDEDSQKIATKCRHLADFMEKTGCETLADLVSRFGIFSLDEADDAERLRKLADAERLRKLADKENMIADRLEELGFDTYDAYENSEVTS